MTTHWIVEQRREGEEFLKRYEGTGGNQDGTFPLGRASVRCWASEADAEAYAAQLRLQFPDSEFRVVSHALDA